MESAFASLIEAALSEDIGCGDVTANFFVKKESRSRGLLVAREGFTVAGTAIAAEVFRRLDAVLDIRILAKDGTVVRRGDVIIEVIGSTRSILTGERTALNFLQRLSGVASLTRQFVALTEGTEARILDTRKTTPGWRHLQKAAVVSGGGKNHRMGLYDRAMVKDNHIVASGINGMQEAITLLHKEHPEVEIELEADTLEQVEAFLGLSCVDYILLDNMSLEQLREAVAMRNAAGVKILLEASGGVNLDTVAGIAKTGVDFISVGALTHSHRAMDISLDLEWLEDDAS